MTAADGALGAVLRAVFCVVVTLPDTGVSSWALADGATNSAKILLNSASDAHPRGLTNGSDQVGRNYMFHNCLAVVALSKERNDTVFQKTLGINDFYFATKDYDYPAGNIQMIGKSNAEAMRGEKPKLTKLRVRKS